jgi:head-tail adaptor
MGLSTFLATGDVSQLRGLAWLSLADVGHVGAGTIVDDAGGGGTTTWAYSGTIPCRVDPLAGTESLVAGRLSDRSTHLLTVPQNTVVTVANRFQIVGGSTYEITAIRDATQAPLLFAEVVAIT